MSVLYRPMKEWPAHIPLSRVKAPFRANHRHTLMILSREIRMINGRDGIVEIALGEHQFTRDGLPYANATPAHPGVIVRVRKPVRNPRGEMDMVPLYFPAGKFQTWTANLRAVAIAMGDLRRIDRYGVTQNSQQYLGFGKYLPGPTHKGVLTLEQAALFVAGVKDAVVAMPTQIITNANAWRVSYRAAAARLHPDAGGDPDQWEMLQAAKTLLDDHHGIRGAK